MPSPQGLRICHYWRAAVKAVVRQLVIPTILPTRERPALFGSICLSLCFNVSHKREGATSCTPRASNAATTSCCIFQQSKLPLHVHRSQSISIPSMPSHCQSLKNWARSIYGTVQNVATNHSDSLQKQTKRNTTPTQATEQEGSLSQTHKLSSLHSLKETLPRCSVVAECD